MTVAKEDERGSLKVRAISKRYGSRLVVNQVDLTILAGEVVGLLGPNGAGKLLLSQWFLGSPLQVKGKSI